MPMRRALGIWLACLATSACAMSQKPQESTSRYPAEANQAPKEHDKTTGGLNTSTSGAAQEHPSGHLVTGPVAQQRTGVAPTDPCCGRMHASASLFGKATWYNLVGRRTASGEILDTVTATAAHRSLPLDSFARVTNLDNGYSLIVKINDRGPYTPGRMLDLSPRAAGALDMKRAGVAPVVLEPLVSQNGQTVAALQSGPMAQ